MKRDPHTERLVNQAKAVARQWNKERLKKAVGAKHTWIPNDKRPIIGVNEGDDKRERPYVVLRDIEYRHPLLKPVRIYEDFTTDLGSIPWLLKWIPGFRPTDPGMRAFLFHDWAYRYRLAERELCDVIMWDALIADGMSRWKAFVCYLGVRIGGRKAYRAHENYDRHFGEPD